MLESLYNSRNVLITGHTGFKGSWLTLWLLELGANVIGYALEPPTDPSLFNILNLKDNITHIIGDIRDSENLKRVFETYKPEFVFHLAAQPIVRYSYKEPKYTYETNIMGTINLLEAARETESVKVVIIITSDKCYENKEWIYGYREIDPMGGYDPYSSSKGCAELIVSAYRRSFFNDLGIALSSVRAGNVIGGGDWQIDRLIPDCVRALSKNETIIIRSPKSVRPWQFILEPLYGYLYLGAEMYKDRNSFNGGWNFGPNDDNIINVEEIVKKSVSLWGNGKYSINEINTFHEAKLLKLDTSKARTLLNFRPIYNIDKALDKTINWYKTYYKENINMFEYSVSQINEYMSERLQNYNF